MIFSFAKIGNLALENRLIRAATFEGLCDQKGNPGKAYAEFYGYLAKQEIGAIITGFAFVEKEGRAVHPGQAGIDEIDKIPLFQNVTDRVHQEGGKIILQIAHTGRQTSSKATGGKVWGVSGKKSPYFQSEPQMLDHDKITEIIHHFAMSSCYAREAGFDGIQLHGAHGYLIHQFLDPKINRRADIFGNRTEFLHRVIAAIREKCGVDFPLLIKISADEKDRKGFRKTIAFLDTQPVDAIEISYGSMENALNIFRGKSLPLDIISLYNFRYRSENPVRRWLWKKLAAPVLSRKIIAFSPTYNLEYAKIARELTSKPIICVGGFRSGTEIEHALSKRDTDFVSLCRPLLCEPDFVKKLKKDIRYRSKCQDCNICAVMCDSEFATRCYHGHEDWNH
ncbi:MAG: NADH:flavin oxidoreductase [Candidatus Marinimicrobia bacterium]|nr:NADH:flavin oxidoreductase [Candidatus Neomarinimicrobiota bacterium]